MLQDRLMPEDVLDRHEPDELALPSNENDAWPELAIRRSDAIHNRKRQPRLTPCVGRAA